MSEGFKFFDYNDKTNNISLNNLIESCTKFNPKERLNAENALANLKNINF